MPMHRLEIGSDLDEVVKVSEWLHELAQTESLPEQTVFRIDLCLAEAVTNAISYGFPEQGRGRIEIELKPEPASVSVTLTDNGVAFDPLEAPAPESPASLEQARIGGLGIHLLRQYSDECHYRRQNECNVLTMRWRFA
jgi:anti-sigma regulatory factor (Ser/Thr protein kinase)